MANIANGHSCTCIYQQTSLHTKDIVPVFSWHCTRRARYDPFTLSPFMHSHARAFVVYSLLKPFTTFEDYRFEKKKVF